MNGITLNSKGGYCSQSVQQIVMQRDFSPLLMRPVGEGGWGYRFPRHLLVSLLFCLPVRPPFVRPSVCLSVRQSTRFFELFSDVLWDIDLKFGIWICLDIIQIMWLLSRVTFFLHELLPFAKVSFSGQFWSSFEILTWVMNWSWRNTGQGQFLSRLTYF